MYSVEKCLTAWLCLFCQPTCFFSSLLRINRTSLCQRYIRFSNNNRSDCTKKDGSSCRSENRRALIAFEDNTDEILNIEAFLTSPQSATIVRTKYASRKRRKKNGDYLRHSVNGVKKCEAICAGGWVRLDEYLREKRHRSGRPIRLCQCLRGGRTSESDSA